jgi:hypothetical protein
LLHYRIPVSAQLNEDVFKRQWINRHARLSDNEAEGRRGRQKDRPWHGELPLNGTVVVGSAGRKEDRGSNPVKFFFMENIAMLLWMLI